MSVTKTPTEADIQRIREAIRERQDVLAIQVYPPDLLGWINNLLAAIDERDGIIADMMLDGGVEKGRQMERAEIVEMLRRAADGIRSYPGTGQARADALGVGAELIRRRGPVADPLPPDRQRTEIERLRRALRKIWEEAEWTPRSEMQEGIRGIARMAREALGETP